MAMIDTAHSAPSGVVTINRFIGEPAGRLIAWSRDRAKAARTADALDNLSPEMLDDIGLTSADVDNYRRQAVFF